MAGPARETYILVRTNASARDGGDAVAIMARFAELWKCFVAVAVGGNTYTYTVHTMQLQ